MAINDFRDLRVWQCGMDLVEQVYQFTASFPSNEIYGLTNQMRRAAVSIPSNIAEGHTRESTREYIHFISIAVGSLSELQTQIEIARRLNYISQDAADQHTQQMVSLAKQLYALRNALTRQR